MAATYALTIYQPWASMIIAGVKPYEFRSWNFMERGFMHLAGERIIIHASARPVREEAIDEAIGQLGDHARAGIVTHDQCLTGETLLRHWRDYRHKLPTAAALGTAIIDAPVKPRGWDNFGWPMKEPQAFNKPTPAKGSQGFWIWQPEPEPGGHACYAVGCAALIPSHLLCCYRHWLCVPRNLQREIYRTHGTDRAAYLMAIKKAREEIAHFEGVEMETAGD